MTEPEDNLITLDIGKDDDAHFAEQMANLVGMIQKHLEMILGCNARMILLTYPLNEQGEIVSMMETSNMQSHEQTIAIIEETLEKMKADNQRLSEITHLPPPKEH